MTNVVTFPQRETVDAVIREAFRTGASSPKAAKAIMALRPGMTRRTADAIVRTEMTRLAAQDANARYKAFTA